MSAPSSSPAAWWSHLEPAGERLFHRRNDPEDPRLGEIVRRRAGGAVEFVTGQPVLLGFACDEGVRRNGGRPGAALAPDAIRRQLYRLTTWEPPSPEAPAEVELARLGLLDLGNVRFASDLETTQEHLGAAVGAALTAGAVPVVLGGGHETAYGHYLAYAAAGLRCAILNIDAHLDVRVYPRGGHSGSPFRQAMDYTPHPLPHGGYVVIGAQRQSVSRVHWQRVLQHGGRVHWADEIDSEVGFHHRVGDELSRLAAGFEAILVTVDADAFRQADVPGVSAPNPLGVDGRLWTVLARAAGRTRAVRSLELVEVNPTFDRDEQTVRWAAVGIRQFLASLALRLS
jgi:formiminoglutamase